MDQTIEQTVNRDTKTRGGIIGFSTNSEVYSKCQNSRGWASFSSQNKNKSFSYNSEISTIERTYIVQHFDIKILMLAHG